MNIENYSYLIPRFQKRSPSINDAAMWFSTILEGVPVEEHPWVWDAMYDIHPDLLLGGLLYPYKDSKMEEYLNFFEQKYGQSFIQKLSQGAAIAANTTYALALLKSSKFTVFNQFYGETNIWTHIAAHIPHNLAMDLLVDNIDKPAYIKALLPKVTNYYFTPEQESAQAKYEISMITPLLHLIEETYPAMEGHPEWENVKRFFEVRMIYEERLEMQEEGSFKTLQSYFFDAMETMLQSWDTLQVPISKLENSEDNHIMMDISPYTDDGLFVP